MKRRVKRNESARPSTPKQAGGSEQRGVVNTGLESFTGRAQPSSGDKMTDRQHLLLIDPDDQIMHSGPSSGMPLFARLGLLRTLEVTESQGAVTQFDSHSSAALGIVSPAATDSDYLDLCLQRCPSALMASLLGLFFRSRESPSRLQALTVSTTIPPFAQAVVFIGASLSGMLERD